MERSSQSDALELSDYLAVVRRRWLIVAFAGLLGLAGAIAYTVVSPKTFTATATVFVTGSTAGASQVVNGRTTGVVDLDTESQIVQSASVASLAKQLLNSPLSVNALSKTVSVTVPPNSQVLQVNCTARTATRSARCAQVFAEAYLQNRSSSQSAAIGAQLSGLQRQVKALQDKITKLTTRIRRMPRGSAERVSANTELSLYNNQLTSLSSHLANLDAQSVNTTGGRIITAASAPSSPTSPKRTLYLPSGLAAGLLIGLLIAFWRDRSDKRIRGGRELEVLLDLPVLVELPAAKKRIRLALAEPRTRTGQAFAELAHSMSATLGQGNHVVLVATPADGRAGSITAVNLASALARTGSEVALVCSDLRRSVTSRILGLSDSPGLSDVILDHATVGDVERRPPQVPRLRVITSGSDREQAADHIERQVLERLITRLHAVARYVVFEVAAAAYTADVYALAELADAAIVAVDVLRTSRDDVQETVRRLDRMGAPVLGAVLIPPIDKAALPPVAVAPAEERLTAFSGKPIGGKPFAGKPIGGKPIGDRRGAQVEPLEVGTSATLEDHLVYPPRADEPSARTSFFNDEPDAAAAARSRGEASGEASGDADTARSRPLLSLHDEEGASADGAPGSSAKG